MSEPTTDAAPAGKPKRADARRETIVAAARALFYQRAYENVSIRDLEKETKLTRGAIYYYFDDKSDIYQAVVADGLAAVVDRLRTVTAEHEGDPERQLRALVRSYIALYDEQRQMFDVHLRYFFGRPNEGQSSEHLEQADLYLREALAIVEGVFAAGVAAGTFDSPDPSFEALAFWGMVSTVVHLSDEDERTWSVSLPKDQLHDKLERHVLASAGIRA